MSFRERPLGRAKNLLQGQLAGQNQKRWPYRSEKSHATVVAKRFLASARNDRTRAIKRAKALIIQL